MTVTVSLPTAAYACEPVTVNSFGSVEVGAWTVPVEVVPFGLSLCQQRIAQLGFAPEPLRNEGQLFVTDNGNHIIECKVPAIRDPLVVEQQLRAIPGVVGTGLFLEMADFVLIEDRSVVTVRARK